jgi:diaminopimelate epimerase
MAIPFIKASACGNDFLIIDGAFAPPGIAELTRRLCDRHRGPGADGVEWLFPAQDADTDARLWNADGSEAEISGNGTRCVAAFISAEKGKERVIIRTGAGLKTCTLTARSGAAYEFETAMGKPEVAPELTLPTSFGQARGIPVWMGNPHCVIFVEKFAPQWQKEAAEVQRNPLFPQGVNVELVVVEDPHNLEARFFERGVGETQSSGTGSCASAVAAIASARCQSPVRVEAPGGVQVVRWNDQVLLRGWAQLVCRGEYFL